MKGKIMPEALFFSKTRDYLDSYLTRQCGKSPHTVKAYRDALTMFRRYILEEKGVSILKFRFSECTREFVLDFICHMKDKGYVPSSCNQRLSAIKAYLWFVADGDITFQPLAMNVSRVPFLREPKLNRDIIAEPELTALLSSTPNSKMGLRDLTIMVLLYDSAIRLSEILELKLSDLNLTTESSYIRIHGKGDKERIVAITAKTVRHLQRYMQHYHPDSTNRNNPLFYTVIKGQMNTMSPGNVERIIKKYADRVREDHPNLPDKVYPHMLRRTRATNLYQSGVELELVSRVLGHNSTQTTRIYAAPSLEMLRIAMESGNQPSIEEPLWSADEYEMARICGLR